MRLSHPPFGGETVNTSDTPYHVKLCQWSHDWCQSHPMAAFVEARGILDTACTCLGLSRGPARLPDPAILHASDLRCLFCPLLLLLRLVRDGSLIRSRRVSQRRTVAIGLGLDTPAREIMGFAARWRAHAQVLNINSNKNRSLTGGQKASRLGQSQEAISARGSKLKKDVFRVLAPSVSKPL